MAVLEKFDFLKNAILLRIQSPQSEILKVGDRVLSKKISAYAKIGVFFSIFIDFRGFFTYKNNGCDRKSRFASNRPRRFNRGFWGSKTPWKTPKTKQFPYDPPFLAKIAIFRTPVCTKFFLAKNALKFILKNSACDRVPKNFPKEKWPFSQNSV